jgi:heterodisulfide reductase subunit A
VELGRHPNIKIITYAELMDVTGKPGRFKARVKKRARSIDPGKCTGCGICYHYCPVRYKPYSHEAE